MIIHSYIIIIMSRAVHNSLISASARYMQAVVFSEWAAINNALKGFSIWCKFNPPPPQF